MAKKRQAHEALKQLLTALGITITWDSPLTGQIGQFMFELTDSYWIVKGPVPIGTALALWQGNTIGQRWIRVQGHAGCPHPLDKIDEGSDIYAWAEYKDEGHNGPRRLFINMYHIDHVQENGVWAIEYFVRTLQALDAIDQPFKVVAVHTNKAFHYIPVSTLSRGTILDHLGPLPEGERIINIVAASVTPLEFARLKSGEGYLAISSRYDEYGNRFVSYQRH
ncbi:MAG: hypothetical protein WCT32_03440 [Patescibacteria group bacterium]|jgi:hypothetical protein